MDGRILHRDYLPGDLPHLLRTASECWPRFFSGDPDADADVALHFVSMFLSRANRSLVAVRDGIPVGFILGRRRPGPVRGLSERAEVDRAAAAERIRASGLCGDYLDFYEGAVGRHLGPSGSAAGTADAEVLLLAVAPAMQGRGIGRALLEGMERIMAAEGAAGISLVSTGFSDHAFYLSAGYEKVSAETAEAGHYGTVSVNVFRRTL